MGDDDWNTLGCAIIMLVLSFIASLICYIITLDLLLSFETGILSLVGLFVLVWVILESEE